MFGIKKRRPYLTFLDLKITTIERIKSMATTKTKTKEKGLELSPFANNGHATEYTKMMHRYADLDKREKAVRCS